MEGQQQTVVVVQQPVAGGAGGQLREWNDGVFSCFSDFGSCEYDSSCVRAGTRGIYRDIRSRSGNLHGPYVLLYLMFSLFFLFLLLLPLVNLVSSSCESCLVLHILFSSSCCSFFSSVSSFSSSTSSSSSTKWVWNEVNYSIPSSRQADKGRPGG